MYRHIDVNPASAKPSHFIDWVMNDALVNPLERKIMERCRCLLRLEFGEPYLEDGSFLMDWKNLKIKDKIAHEAIKEHWRERLESDLDIQDEKSFGVQHHLTALNTSDEEYVSDNPIIRFRPY
jgi:hypothetical protein